MYKIVQAPHQILSTAAQPVPKNLPGLKRIIEEMRDTLLAQVDPEGVGLAANQVNLPYKLFLARFSTKKTEPVRVFINPEITSHSDDFQPEKYKDAPLEGCLSIPKFYGVVKRFAWVQLKFQNEKFEEKNERFAGFPAVVIQHEMDHLTGHVFMEKLLEQKGRIYRVTGKDKKGKDEWEEVDLCG
jgi:peptide deformylase